MAQGAGNVNILTHKKGNDMSAGNMFETRRKAFLKSTIAFDGSDMVSYTVKVGSSSDNFICDRVINVTSVDYYGNITITVPDGIYSGQRLLVNLVASDAADAVIVTPDTAEITATYNLATVGDYCTLEWIDSGTGWINWNSQVT